MWSVEWIGLFWKDDIDLRILSSSPHHIDAKVGATGEAFHWRLTGFYGHLNTGDILLSWGLLRSFAGHNQLSWVVEGDFNELFLESEKEGGGLGRWVRYLTLGKQ